MPIIEGTLAFDNLVIPDKFNDTADPTWGVVLNLTEESAEDLRDQGVQVKYYSNGNGEDTAQRKFGTKYEDSFKVVNGDGEPRGGKFIPRGSLVRVQYVADQKRKSPTSGVPTYLQFVKVLEEAEGRTVEEGF